MSGTSHVALTPGDRCIIFVNPVNSPSGWWWGRIVSCEEGGKLSWPWFKVDAVITGVFNRGHERDLGRERKVEYGTQERSPSINYDVYPADKGTVYLVDRALTIKKQADHREHDLKISNRELRDLIGERITPTDPRAGRGLTKDEYEKARAGTP